MGDGVDGVDGGVWAIVLGGGSGARFGGAKQFEDLGGRSLLARSVAAAATVADGVVVVVPGGLTPDGLPPVDAKLVVAPGGAERAASVRSGLAAVPEDAGIVVVADAAHPLASPVLFAAVVDAVRAGAGGALPGLPLTEVIARVDADGTRTGGLPRAGHVLVQMPHAFRADLLRAAHATGEDGAEDSAMVAALGARVVVVPGEPTNLHVTTPEELVLARRLVG
ncbi:MAG: 2-C-methyl-D-erythritol 4-phosphate cytidylyltransferase [Actinomycetota bacterium]|nr:2-C-methyl-D-erythritol 4-phosphate cytidylyltransferase [Actinomycetota bacterium]